MGWTSWVEEEELEESSFRPSLQSSLRPSLRPSLPPPLLPSLPHLLLHVVDDLSPFLLPALFRG